MAVYENREAMPAGNADIARAPVFPLARVQWPAVVAGAFVALAVFVVSALLARACGVTWTYGTSMTTGQETAVIIWGGVAALIAFGLGGLVSVRLATRGAGWANGLLVWAVTVPMMVFFMGAGFGPMLGREAELPSQRIYGTNELPAVTGGVTSTGHAQAAAWWALVSLACGFIGAVGVGAMSNPEGTTRRIQVRTT